MPKIRKRFSGDKLKCRNFSIAVGFAAAMRPGRFRSGSRAQFADSVGPLVDFGKLHPTILGTAEFGSIVGNGTVRPVTLG